MTITLYTIRGNKPLLIKKFGEYKLSPKALKKQKSEFEKYSGINDANEIRLILLDSGGHKNFYDFYYIDNRTKEVIGMSEYRKLDSYFVPTILGYKPKVLNTKEVFADLPVKLDNQALHELSTFFDIV